MERERSRRSIALEGGVFLMMGERIRGRRTVDRR